MLKRGQELRFTVSNAATLQVNEQAFLFAFRLAPRAIYTLNVGSYAVLAITDCVYELHGAHEQSVQSFATLNSYFLALRPILKDPPRITLITGEASSGKHTLALAACNAFLSRGLRPFLMDLSARTDGTLSMGRMYEPSLDSMFRYSDRYRTHFYIGCRPTEKSQRVYEFLATKLVELTRGIHTVIVAPRKLASMLLAKAEHCIVLDDKCLEYTLSTLERKRSDESNGDSHNDSRIPVSHLNEKSANHANHAKLHSIHLDGVIRRSSLPRRSSLLRSYFEGSTQRRKSEIYTLLRKDVTGVVHSFEQISADLLPIGHAPRAVGEISLTPVLLDKKYIFTLAAVLSKGVEVSSFVRIEDISSTHVRLLSTSAIGPVVTLGLTSIRC
jgi:hypothetical protein